MTEKVYALSTCERCGHEEKRELKHRLKLMKKPKRPSGWLVINGVELCSNCVTEHNQAYSKMFTAFMSEGEKK